MGFEEAYASVKLLYHHGLLENMLQAAFRITQSVVDAGKVRWCFPPLTDHVRSKDSVNCSKGHEVARACIDLHEQDGLVMLCECANTIIAGKQMYTSPLERIADPV